MSQYQLGDFIKQVELVNFENFDEVVLEKVRDVSQPLLDKYSRKFADDNIQEFKLVVDTIRQKQQKHLYEVIGTLKTSKHVFRTDETGWEILDVVEKVVAELRRMIREKKDRTKSKRHGPANA